MLRKSKKTLSRAELEAENRFLRVGGIGNNITKVILSVIKYATYCFIALMCYLSINSLSGKITLADIKVQADGSFKAPSEVKNDENDISSCLLLGFLGLIFGGSGLIYGRMQAKLRRDTVESLQGRVVELETTLDSDRTSSRLTKRGDTRPEDL